MFVLPLVCINYLILRREAQDLAFWVWIPGRGWSFQPRTEGQIAGSPRMARLVVRLALDPRTSEPLLGDLEELFPKMVTDHGTTVAHAWYWWQAVRVVISLVPWKTILGLGAVREAIKRLAG